MLLYLGLNERERVSMSILDKKPKLKKGNFLSKIPGFRSNNPLFEIVAWVYYIFLIISVIAVWGEMNLLVILEIKCSHKT